MARIPLDDALDLHGIPVWGHGFFGISRSGALTVRPTREAGREVVLPDLLARLREEGRQTPLVFRFPQMLGERVGELTRAFSAAITEFDYGAGYRPVFPIKVNQRRGVVEALLDAGRAHGLGLEVGSRAELLAALGMDLPDDALVILNGYKDDVTLELASLGIRSGRRVVVVIEKPFEVKTLARAYAGAPRDRVPWIGLRARLSARGAGKWWKSSGTTAKFGLTTAALIDAFARLREEGLADRVAMLHFHIGSQIPEIRRLKVAFREGARVYAKLCQLGAPLRWLNAGGGLAVDYDGSRTASDASMNYTVEEYANGLVYTVREVCEEEQVPHPTLVTESGRALTAYHAMLVTDVVGRIGADPSREVDPRLLEDAPRVLVELHALRDEMGAKTWREFYHDAVEHRDELTTLFNIGLLSLEQRALAEQLFWDIARAALGWSRREKVPMQEFEQLERALHEKYILNFSVFQSAPDHWALDQLFPIVPLTRLTEPAPHPATLVDITCDSDGEIDRFVDVKDVREAIALHAADGAPYDLAILLLGAYQDVMGDMHNLFGTPDDVYVSVGEDGAARVDAFVPGDTVGNVLAAVGYDVRALVERIAARLGPEDAERARGFCRALLSGGTYLGRPEARLRGAGGAAPAGPPRGTARGARGRDRAD